MPKKKSTSSSAAAAKKAAKAASQSQKAAKSALKSRLKAKSKSQAHSSSSEDDSLDLDSILASYAASQALHQHITETPSPTPPSPRSSATLIASPHAHSPEIFLFGGEHFDGTHASFSNELWVYHTLRREWRVVTSPNSPLPRSGHAWTRGGNMGGVWLFGGEFSSPKQGTFYHYGDFWRLETETGKREWGKVEPGGKGGKGSAGGGGGGLMPSARSGHRMTYYKQYILLFGGFQDTSQNTKYLGDLWVYDTLNFCWWNPALPPASPKPEPRSSCSFLPHEQGAVLFGGYSRVKANDTTKGAGAGGGNKGAGGSQKKGGNPSKKSVYKPVVHQDTWFLRITPPATASSDAGAPPMVRWERRKKPANAPNPARAGASMVWHKSRGIMFGGVHDVEESEEGIDSEFFNSLFAWNIDRNRFFPLSLRRPRGGQGQQKVDKGGGGRRGRGEKDEEELLRNLAKLETKGTFEGEGIEIDASDVVLGGKQEDENAGDKKEEIVVLNEFPHARFNAQLAVLDDVLYIFGGTYEAGDKEYTFDEMHAIDLGKLDGVKQIFRREIDNWAGSEDEMSEDDEDDEDEESDDEEEGGVKMELDERSVDTTEALPSFTTTSLTVPEEQEEAEPISFIVPDNKPYPRPFESLRDFYARTSLEWQEVVIQDLKDRGEAGAENSTIKELKKMAFDLAETKWWDVREEVMAMEDEQEEAGIGEIVSLGDKAGAGSGSGGAIRRR